MKTFSGLKDTDREILKHVEDKELLTICSIDKRMWNSVCDDDFLKRRLSKYPGIEKYRKTKESWKEFFLRAIYTIAKMQEEYEFTYESGDFGKQYYMLKKYGNYLPIQAARDGELSLVKYGINKGFNIRAYHNEALRLAAGFGHIDIVKYLVEVQKANIHAKEDEAVRFASRRGHLDVVKYLVEHGANIHAQNNYALKWAKGNEHKVIVDYLNSLN